MDYTNANNSFLKHNKVQLLDNLNKNIKILKINKGIKYLDIKYYFCFLIHFLIFSILPSKYSPVNISIAVAAAW